MHDRSASAKSWEGATGIWKRMALTDGGEDVSGETRRKLSQVGRVFRLGGGAAPGSAVDDLPRKVHTILQISQISFKKRIWGCCPGARAGVDGTTFVNLGLEPSIISSPIFLAVRSQFGTTFVQFVKIASFHRRFFSRANSRFF